jgi:tRNA(fMet)-specific endonuclease VapC
MTLLLDTNAYVALMHGHAGTANKVRRAERIIMSAIVVGELIFGFRNGSRYEKNISELDDFLENRFVEFLPVSYTTADRFGRISAFLRQNGTPMPSNDIWIAAHAIESGAELVSFDRHFEHIEGLVWTKMQKR